MSDLTPILFLMGVIIATAVLAVVLCSWFLGIYAAVMVLAIAPLIWDELDG